MIQGRSPAGGAGPANWSFFGADVAEAFRPRLEAAIAHAAVRVEHHGFDPARTRWACELVGHEYVISIRYFLPDAAEAAR